MQTEAIASQASTEALEPKRWCHLAYECPNCGADDIEPQEVVDLSR